MAIKNSLTLASSAIANEESLQELRDKIDILDKKLVEQLDQRASLVFQVGEWKKKKKISKIRDPQREKNILNQILLAPHEYLLDSELQTLFKKIIDFYYTTECARIQMSKATLPHHCRVGFVGFGLMGASIGLALKEKYPAWEFLVHDPFINPTEFKLWSQENGNNAFSLVDQSEIKNLDYVFLGAPVHINQTFAPTFVNKNKFVLNLGSVLSTIQNVYGFHPLSGKEISTFHAGQADLFYGKIICLTNTEKSTTQDVETLRMIAYSLGATPHEVSAPQHNETLAYTSHLLHLLSMTLALCLNGQGIDQKLEMIPQAAKDFLRLAGANQKMWEPILKENKVNILKAIEDFELKLKEIKKCIKEEMGIERLFSKSHEIYKNVYQKRSTT